MNAKTVINEILNLFYPHCCPGCNVKLLPEEESICINCIHKLPRTNNFNEPGNLAEVLLAGRFPFERAATFCVFTKQGILQSLIHELKYNGNRNMGVFLGRLFGKDLAGSDFLNTIDYIIPIPLHPKKQKLRGYNQAEMIANGISQSTNIPVSTGNLIRVIHNPTQTKLSRTQRWENVHGIFDLINPDLYANKHVLLVDDIITTGSTIEASAHALLRSENIKISVATIGDVN